MSRAALRQAPSIDTDSSPEKRLYLDVVFPLLDAEGAGKLLGGISAAQVDKLRDREGLPAIDLSSGDPARRRKGLWRYDPAAIREWWRKRGGQP